MDDAMLALEHSLREGTLDKEALDELKIKSQKSRTLIATASCTSEPECLIYDC